MIDRRIPVPAYYQLKQLIKEQIAQGALKTGDQIPTEAELCERYQISRTPVRQALLDLTSEGLLIRTPGRGTFVAGPVLVEPARPQVRALVPEQRWGDLLEQASVFWNRTHLDTQFSLDITQTPLHDLRATLIAAVGQGAAPDISFLDSVWVAEFASRHALQALPERVAAPAGADTRPLFPALLAANRYGGELYGMPISASASLLWYRRDWLVAEGLAPPATWDDLLAIGQHFQQPAARARYGLGAHPIALVAGRVAGETTTFQLLPFIWAAGGDLISRDRVVLDSLPSRSALMFLSALVHEHRLVSPDAVSYEWEQAASALAHGQVALALGGTYESFFIRAQAGWDEQDFAERVGFVPVPAGPGGQPTSLVGGNSLVIYRQAQSPVLAQALLELINTDSTLQPFGERMAPYSPLISSVQHPTRSDDTLRAQVAPLLRIARARPAIPDYARVSEQFQLLVEDCLAGRRQVDQAVARSAELIAAITGLPLA